MPIGGCQPEPGGLSAITKRNEESVMSRKSMKPVAKAIGAAMAGTLLIGGTASAATGGGNPFALTELSGGYTQLASDHGGGKCGAGKCGAGKCGGDKGMEGKCGAGKCGGDKGMEGKCGAGKCGAGKCGGDKGMEGKCGAGKCGAGKCGGAN
jgi:uncharacterized low-complexity protein